MAEHKNVLLEIAKDYDIEPGFEWGFRSVRPDFTSTRGFRWLFPGNWAEASGPFTSKAGGCPSAEGDGICTATTFAGMASGGTPAFTVLLTAHDPADVLGSERGKLRAKRIYVVDVIDMTAWLKRNGCGADLHGADLRHANLRGADLYGANLYGAIGYTKTEETP